jgi:hypothetical protein
MSAQTPVENPLISALRVDLYDCINERPAEILEPHKPKDFTRHAWIPMPIGDQIWVAYQFRTVEARLAWEESLPPLIKGWLARDLITHMLPYGWIERVIGGGGSPLVDLIRETPAATAGGNSK